MCHPDSQPRLAANTSLLAKASGLGTEREAAFADATTDATNDGELTATATASTSAGAEAASEGASADGAGAGGAGAGAGTAGGSEIAAAPWEGEGGREKLDIGAYEEIRLLGLGSFGSVKLVQHRGTKRAFALKRLQKHMVVMTKQTNNIKAEKKIMLLCQHPFVLRLVSTGQDDDCLYMLMELVPGGELFRLLHGDGTEELILEDEQACFYAACVTMVFGYLHKKAIAYRDLKPENLLIDAEGYIKVVDFGFAKILGAGKTFTVCGTPEYLAPEIIHGTGHGKGVDCWALGCLIYEMLSGTSPFVGDDYGDTAAISKNILENELKFPSEWTTELGRKGAEAAKDLTSGLLQRDLAMRLGCLKGGIGDIQRKQWFKDTDWDAMYKRQVTAPWIPTLAKDDPLDASNFDDYDPEEEEPVVPFDGDGAWSEGF